MNISDLYYKLLDEKIDHIIAGELLYEYDEYIRWEYDGLFKCNGNMEDHLLEIFENDKEIIDNFLSELNVDKYFFINQPNFDHSSAYFLITEK